MINLSKMHAFEWNVDLHLVKELINEQFPEYAMLPISPANSKGTVNHIYRLGQEFYIRIPRVPDWGDIEKDFRWLPYLAPHLTLRIPEPIAMGQPNDKYPASWGIYRWIDGSEYSDELIHDENDLAKELARFVNQLRSIDIPIDAPRAGRLPLLELNNKTLEAIETAKDDLDAERVLAAWKNSCQASVWNGSPVWIHADLLRTNLLVHSGRLASVIDFGSAGVGDPAFDLIPAWSIFKSKGRKMFQHLIQSDKDTWLRARGYALHQALLIIPYYRETFPKFVDHAKRTINEILLDIE